MSFIPSMTMVESMNGGRSPISDGVMVSPKAAFTVHDAGHRFSNLFLRPVPDVEAPLSMITLFSFEAIHRTRCAGRTACRRFSLGAFAKFLLYLPWWRWGREVDYKWFA